MIQKIFEIFFFAFLESTYFNSRKNAIKKFSADFPLYDGLGLFFSNFFFLIKKFLTYPIRKVIMLKVGFEDLQNFSPLPGHPGSTLRKLLQKVSKWFNLQSYVRIDTCLN